MSVVEKHSSLSTNICLSQISPSASLDYVSNYNSSVPHKILNALVLPIFAWSYYSYSFRILNYNNLLSNFLSAMPKEDLFANMPNHCGFYDYRKQWQSVLGRIWAFPAKTTRRWITFPHFKPIQPIILIQWLFKTHTKISNFCRSQSLRPEAS